MKKVAAIILARAGSKGIPDKNLKEILGQSLIYRTAKECVSSSLDSTFVYSDSDKILSEADKAGATAVKRPEEAAGDKISSEDTIKRFLEDHDPEKSLTDIAMVQCTTPFLKAEHIDKVVSKYSTGKYDSVITATEMPRYFGYKSGATRKEFIPLYPYRALRQHMISTIFIENGGVYLTKRKLWETGRRLGPDVGTVLMDWWESVEIDEPADLEAARRLASMFLKG